MAEILNPLLCVFDGASTPPWPAKGRAIAFESLQGTDFSPYISCRKVIAGLRLYGRTLQTAPLPVFADNYPAPAHNQNMNNHQSRRLLLTTVHCPLTHENRIYSPSPLPQLT
jgi:hypothetical protein